MRIETLEHLYIEQLKDLHDAETQLHGALPGLAENASASALRSKLTADVAAVSKQRGKIEKLFENRDARPDGERCQAMAGLLKEVRSIVDMCETPEVRDAALIAGLQRIKHYEIAGYGCARAYARRLGEDEAVETLTRILDEEAAEDEKLTELATGSINRMAVAPAGV